MTALFEPTTFVGRADELDGVLRRLASSGLVTLIGSGGVGKSRLARRVCANEAARADSPEVHQVDLTSVLDPGVVEIAVAGALGLRTQPGDRQVELIAAFFDDRRTLLLLDNCEQVRDACGRLTVELRSRCPRLQVLVTSREPMGIQGEHVYRVPPLAVPGPEVGDSAAEVAAYEAVSLFVDRAVHAFAGFELHDGNARAVADVCRLLDGVPLALELAAARSRVLSPAEMVARLGRSYSVLEQGFADQPDRHRSLEASVTWSHALCDAEERLLWWRLSVFRDAFDLTAAEEVCSDEALPRREVLTVLSSLVDKSIVFRETGEEPAFFRMLEPLRRYGAARLAEQGDATTWHRRHRDHFFALASDIRRRWLGEGQIALLQRCVRHHDNFRVVLDEATSQRVGAAPALRMCLDLDVYWVTSGRLAEGRHWLEAALAHDEGTAAERASGYALAAYLASLQGDDAGARALLDQARAWAPQGPPVAHGDQMPMARIAYAEGVRLLFAGETASALEHALASRDHFAAVPDTYGEAQAGVLVGLSLSGEGRLTEAIEAKKSWLAHPGWTHEQFLRSMVLWLLALDAREVGDLQWATECAVDSLRLKIELGDLLGVAMTLEGLASIASVGGNEERSALLLGAADSAWGRVGVAAMVAPYVARQRELGQRLARAGMSEQAFARAFARGKKLTETEVLAVLQGPVEARHPLEDSPLTRREREVALLLGEGLSNQELADRLVISLRTAQGHVENILRKLGMQSRAQVAAWVTRAVAER